jgi:hypothetical protein
MSHSRLSPSSASQWTSCTASIGFIAENAGRIPPDRGSIYAQVGTQAHDYAEKILTGRMKVKNLPPEFSPVLEYTSRCEALKNRWKGNVFIEEKVPLFYLPDETGTVDFALLCDQGLFIRDLKYGEGVPVDAEENKQLAIYAHSLVVELAMLYDLHDDLSVDIGIISPRYVGEDIEKVWITTVKGLRDFVMTNVAPAADAILNGGEVQFKPSKSACRWCRAARAEVCRVRHREALKPIGYDEFMAAPEVEITPPNLKTLSDADILKIYANTDVITNVLNSVAALVTERALRGNPIPGTKLVEGRQGNTEWVPGSEPFVELWLKDAAYVKKLISPTQALKLLPKEQQELAKRDYTRRSPGKPVVALESDKRPAIQAAIDQFSTYEASPDSEMEP